MLQTHSPTVMLANAIGQSDIPVGNATYLAFLVSRFDFDSFQFHSFYLLYLVYGGKVSLGM